MSMACRAVPPHLSRACDAARHACLPVELLPVELLIRLPWLHEAVFVGEYDGLDSVAQVELAQDVVDVCFHCPFAEEELFGDFAVR